MTDLTNPIYQDEETAREHLEAIRWGKGRYCPHCGEAKRTSETDSKNHKAGLYYCLSCEKTFTVTVGTLFERSHIPLNKWVLGFHLMAASKKGISAHQLHRMLKITYKSAWFMAHRIREAMRSDFSGPLGGFGKVVEADETYWGNKKKAKRYPQGMEHKQKIFSLLERKGQVRSFHVPSVTGKTLKPILREHVRKETAIYTDEHGAYSKLDREFFEHQTVAHSRGEYARGPVTTNTVEGFFSILKRGLIGTYHHVSEIHLQRYINEFDFRYNHRTSLGVNDEQRAEAALKGITGKRLTYRRIDTAA